MKESAFTAKICKTLESQGAVILALVGGFRQTRGIPDRFVAHPKWSGFLEFKGAATRLELHQKILIEKLVKRGVNCQIYRYPNRIENTAGDLIATAAAIDLLDTLRII